MTELKPIPGVTEHLNYDEYRFGRARQVFRGPMPDLTKPYVACIGASETYGKFSPITYPDLLQEKLGHQVSNWGTPGAGPGFFLKDPVILEACSCAKVCVIAAMSAHTMNNRLYSVFVRRNERFREPSEMLTTLYPEVDFAEFRFVHNMLVRLHEVDAQRFNMILLEFKQSWIARMKELLTDIETKKVLLWFSEIAPEVSGALSPKEGRHALPAFITREMIEAVKGEVDVFVEYVANPEAARGSAGDRLLGMQGLNVARRFPSATMHREVADLLEDPLRYLLGY